MVIFPHGTLGLWRGWIEVRYNLISLQKDLLFWPCFCSFHCSISVIPFNLYLQMSCQCSANSDFWPLFSFSFSSVLQCSGIQSWSFHMERWGCGDHACKYVTIWSPFKKIYYFDHVFALFLVQFPSFLSICIYKCIANVQQILTFDLCSLFHFSSVLHC